MKHLYAPWRSMYADEHDHKKKNNAENACVFCTKLINQNSEKSLVIKAFSHCYLSLNRYPYNAGHLLIIPNDHQSELKDLTPETRAQMMELTSQCTAICKEQLKADGVNIGMNMGKASGGSIPEHLHMHVLPRWLGDTNFLVALTDTKVISRELNTLFAELREIFAKHL